MGPALQMLWNGPTPALIACVIPRAVANAVVNPTALRKARSRLGVREMPLVQSHGPTAYPERRRAMISPWICRASGTRIVSISFAYSTHATADAIPTDRISAGNDWPSS